MTHPRPRLRFLRAAPFDRALTFHEEALCPWPQFFETFDDGVAAMLLK